MNNYANSEVFSGFAIISPDDQVVETITDGACILQPSQKHNV